jgi:hypothetical protein
MRKKKYLGYFKSLFGNNPAQMVAMLETCSGEWAMLLEKLEKAVAERNAHEIIKLGGRLRSCFQYSGQEDMVECVARLEQFCGEKNRWTDIKMLIEVIKVHSKEPLWVYEAEILALKPKVK